MNLEEGI